LDYYAPFDTFRNIGETDCSLLYGKYPENPANLIPKENELLPPCDQPGDQEKRQKGIDDYNKEELRKSMDRQRQPSANH
jgi:hypothetical protein